ncbi:RIO1 family regulatory kinase/ATPase [Microbacterium sp. GbtcB4]|uniref:RIO1 family regulatory kinase/ATPase domain-containing protein n=1 Tax=Microbacterium sp. GbtcB4 TaxID=2824749 RepID=UPI0034D4BCC4
MGRDLRRRPGHRARHPEDRQGGRRVPAGARRARRHDAAHPPRRQALPGHREPELPALRRLHRGTQHAEHRDTRALAKKTAHGREVAAAQWSLAEFEALCRMWERGAPVPYPVQVSGTEVLMEFLGDDRGIAAPRLAQVRGSNAEMQEYFTQVADLMRVFAAAGFAHGDLSAYNLLVHDGRVRVIDLPQIVDVIANPQGLDLLHRDCVNVCDWFARRRVECDAEALFADLLGTLF